MGEGDLTNQTVMADKKHVPGEEYDAVEMAELYSALPNKWMLLEILKTDKNGRAQRLKLIAYADGKDALYDYLMNETHEWEWDQKYIFLYSDPEKECELY